jgi:hypothetical protein
MVSRTPRPWPGVSQKCAKRGRATYVSSRRSGALPVRRAENPPKSGHKVAQPCRSYLAYPEPSDVDQSDAARAPDRRLVNERYQQG